MAVPWKRREAWRRLSGDDRRRVRRTSDDDPLLSKGLLSEYWLIWVLLINNRKKKKKVWKMIQCLSFKHSEGESPDWAARYVHLCVTECWFLLSMLQSLELAVEPTYTNDRILRRCLSMVQWIHSTRDRPTREREGSHWLSRTDLDLRVANWSSRWRFSSTSSVSSSKRLVFVRSKSIVSSFSSIFRI